MKAVCYYFNQKMMLCGNVTKILSGDNIIVIKIEDTEIKIKAPHGEGQVATPFLSEMWFDDKPLIISQGNGGTYLINADTDEEIFIKK